LRSDTVRVSKAKLNEMLLRAEELIPLKQNAEQLASDLRDLRESAASLKRSWGRLRQDMKTVRQWTSRPKDPGLADRPRLQLHRMWEFLDRNQSFVEQMEKSLQSAWKSAEQNSHSLRGTGDNLLRDAKATLMLPLSSLFEVLPTFVREIARDQGKEVDLAVDGPDVEVDQRILEEAKDCFIQMIRNSIGHGIERAEARLVKGKPARGRIGVKVAPEVEGGLTVDFSDDGAGIDARKILAAGIEQGLLAPADAEGLSEREILPLIFQSGISTSPAVTELAGRGLGLAIVWEKLGRLGGSISLESHSPLGTTFRIRLPLAMATFRGMLVRAGDGMFVVPTSAVERVTKWKGEEIKTLAGREVVPMASQSIPLVPLSEVLGLPARRDELRSRRGGKPIMVLGGAGKSIAFLVDEVVGELEVLVKGLGPQLSRVRNISGATILGSGKIVFILNVPDLMKSAMRHAYAPEPSAPQPAPPPQAAADAPEAGAPAGGQRRILVVDDSITYRSLLRDMLENRGYQVATAVDGLDALAKLRDAAFGAVLADVDMPRLDGFELTARIRSDAGLSGLPVILVTAMESPQSLAKGMDSGASAYVVKSSLDPNDLVKTLERLL
jgi:two-component system chemotaxis sensor kinase CheA